MPATATRMNAGRTRGETANSTGIDYVEGEEWLVVDASSQSEALAATGLPVHNQERTPGSALRVRSRQADNYEGAPTTWRIRIDYGVPPNGQYSTFEIDPLQRPMRVRWGQGFTQKQIDIDVYGQLIRNSAGDFFNPSPTIDRRFETLVVTRYEPFYDRAKARKYAGKTNSDQFTIGSTALLPGECKCTSIAPTTEYELNAPYVEIAYQFEISIDDRHVVSGVPNTSGDILESGYPFDAHIIDQGLRGWYIDPADSTKKIKGWFCTYRTSGSDKIPISILTDPVLLNGNGVPLASSITGATVGVADSADVNSAKVYDATYPPPTAADLVGQTVDGGTITVDRVSPLSNPSKAVVWRYPIVPSIPFANMLDR